MPRRKPDLPEDHQPCCGGLFRLNFSIPAHTPPTARLQRGTCLCLTRANSIRISNGSIQTSVEATSQLFSVYRGVGRTDARGHHFLGKKAT
jgi:hypothetical protein